MIPAQCPPRRPLQGFVVDRSRLSKPLSFRIAVLHSLCESLRYFVALFGASQGWSYQGTAECWHSSSSTRYLEPFAGGDTITVEVDVEADTLVFFKNGVTGGVVRCRRVARCVEDGCVLCQLSATAA